MNKTKTVIASVSFSVPALVAGLAACAGTSSSAFVEPAEGPAALLTVRSLHEGVEWRNQFVYHVPGEMVEQRCSREPMQILANLNNDYSIAPGSKYPSTIGKVYRLALRQNTALARSYADKGANVQSVQLKIPATGQAFRVLTNEFYFDTQDQKRYPAKEDFCQPNVRFIPEAGKRYEVTLGPGQCEISLTLQTEQGPVGMTTDRQPPCITNGMTDSYYDKLVNEYRRKSLSIPDRISLWGPSNQFERDSALGKIRK